jgi:hypothetical protein
VAVDGGASTRERNSRIGQKRDARSVSALSLSLPLGKRKCYHRGVLAADGVRNSLRSIASFLVALADEEREGVPEAFPKPGTRRDSPGRAEGARDHLLAGRPAGGSIVPAGVLIGHHALARGRPRPQPRGAARAPWKLWPVAN